MIQYARPPEDGGFGSAVGNHVVAIRAEVDAGAKPRWTDREAWKAFKAAFSVAQHRKCGYCESKVAATQAGDVEHVAPKGEWWDLPAAEKDWGVELVEGLSNLKSKSRKKGAVRDRGYWWLAYRWTNYLFACTVCNSKYKLSYYPLDRAPVAGWLPAENDGAQALLLGCFDDPEPWRHFTFDLVTGKIGWSTPRGRATVATCGLFRATLTQDRLEAIQDAVLRCKRISKAVREHDAWRDLVELGGERRAFAGAVRWVAENQLALTWPQIKAFVAQLPP